jgi:hypothetical protein
MLFRDAFGLYYLIKLRSGETLDGSWDLLPGQVYNTSFYLGTPTRLGGLRYRMDRL